MISFDFEVLGEDIAARQLREMGDRGGDMRPPLLLIRELLVEGHQQQFSSQGSFFGAPWAPNAPGTLARKAREGQGGRVMRGTGALEAALRGGKGRKGRVTRTTASAGVSLFYAGFGHRGTKRQPPRPLVGITESQRGVSLGLLERHLLGRL